MLHFYKQFDHEPTPKQMQKITEHETIWKGNIISVMKTFGTLHCTLCMKERCQIIKEKCEKNNKIMNSCNEIHGACRHKPRFHHFKNHSGSADEPLEGKRVNMPSRKKKGERRDSTNSVESSGSNHSLLSSPNLFSTCSTRKKKKKKKKKSFLTRVRKNSSDSVKKVLCVSV